MVGRRIKKGNGPPVARGPLHFKVQPSCLALIPRSELLAAARGFAASRFAAGRLTAAGAARSAAAAVAAAHPSHQALEQARLTAAGITARIAARVTAARSLAAGRFAASRSFAAGRFAASRLTTTTTPRSVGRLNVAQHHDGRNEQSRNQDTILHGEGSFLKGDSWGPVELAKFTMGIVRPERVFLAPHTQFALRDQFRGQQQAQS